MKASPCMLRSLALALTLPLFVYAADVRDPAASRQIYNDIHAQLDDGGDLIVIANVEGLLEKAVSTAKRFAAMAPQIPGQMTGATETVDRLSAFLKRNGFYAVSGVGLSVVPRADGQSDIKSFIARDAESARLPLWLALIGGAPSPMRVHAYLPKDAVLARSGTADLRALWQLAKSGITDIGGAEAASRFEMSLGMLAAQAGISADTLIQSIAPEGAVSIQLSSTATATIPTGESSITIPAPSLLLITAVTNSTIIDAIKKGFATNLQMPLPEVRVGEAVVYNVPIPAPAPFPMQITLATHGNYLLIGTTSEVVTEALAAATQGNGLTSTPEFKAAFPTQAPNNGIQFASRRLGQVLKSVRDQLAPQIPVGSEEAATYEMIKGWMDENLETAAAFTVYNMRLGVLISGTSASGGHQMIGAMFAAPVGLLAGIAVPSFVKARGTAQNNSCINNLRQLDSAKEQWAMANNKNDGDGVVNTEVEEYIKGGAPTCPAGGTYTYGPVGTLPTCSHPGHSL